MKTYYMDRNSITTYFFSFFTVFSGLTLSQWGTIVGICVSIIGCVCAVISVVYNIYHKRKVRKILGKKHWLENE